MTPRDLVPIAIVVALLALVPVFVTANTVLNFVVFVLIIALAAQGWNVLGGYGGQLSFGHAAFFGTGAYTTAMLQTGLAANAWLGLACGVAAGAAMGWAIGFLSFRAGLRGSYFALVTLAFAEVLRIAVNAAPATGGAAGLLLKLDPGAANLQFQSRAAFFWLALAFVAAVLVLSRWLERSRFGAQLVALRENEESASALGIDPLGVKLKAMALSGAITAAAGCLYTQYFLYLDAGIAFGTWISVEALLAVIAGGAGTVFGPLLGAAVLHGLGELAKSFAGRVPGIDLVVFGTLLILVVAFTPRGLMGLIGRPGRFWRRPAPSATGT